MRMPSDAEAAATESVAPPFNECQGLQALSERRAFRESIETAATFIAAKVVIMRLTKCMVVGRKKVRLLMNGEGKEHAVFVISNQRWAKRETGIEPPFDFGTT